MWMAMATKTSLLHLFLWRCGLFMERVDTLLTTGPSRQPSSGRYLPFILKDTPGVKQQLDFVDDMVPSKLWQLFLSAYY